jgi:hypothetical protein
VLCEKHTFLHLLAIGDESLSIYFLFIVFYLIKPLNL